MFAVTRRPILVDLMMLLAAVIWGSAFVAQRLSAQDIGSFYYTGLRFLLGAAVVFVFCLLIPAQRKALRAIPSDRALLCAGGVLGVVTAVAISAQQIGLQYTKVANAGFITSLYVIIVPMMGLFARHKTATGTWVGAVLAVVGMYFLSVDDRFTIQLGDWYQLVCAIVISGQVLLVGRYARVHDPLALSLVQFVATGLISLSVAAFVEPISPGAIRAALPAILYGGGLSVGVAYTIQVVAQKRASPAHAAVIFSMEGLFAAIAGWLVLGETLSWRAIGGCALMLAGLLVCQLLPGRAHDAHLPSAANNGVAADA
ncbi:MAG TPA: DMT family transporter [Pararobbsia sp.]|nr:DMT family transporter [Pararobbsia sp.]